MPYSTFRPELMGSATLTPSGRIEAGSYQSFTLVYTAGAFGVDDTGSIKIAFRFATDFGPVQFNDPKAAGYTTLEASNGATLEARWEFKRNIRPWSRSLYIGVMKHFLKPGDTITIRFGDTRHGSPGVRVQTYCEKIFEFHVLVDAIATYDYVALPQSPSIEIVPGPGITWHALLPTVVRAGAPFRFGIKVDDAWGNPSDRTIRTVHLKPSRAISGLPETVELRDGTFGATLEGLAVSTPGDLTINVVGSDGTLLARSNPLRIVDAVSTDVHFWADTHGQSDETLGTNPARDYFLFGRDRAYLDVMSHQGNDFQITGQFWHDLNTISAELDEPGRFVCIPGYEWSANTAVGGDRNVMYRREGETIHRSSHAQITEGGDMADEGADAHDASELFEKLAGKDCVVMAHVGGRYADIKYAHDGTLETAVEVHSAWGTFEWILWDAFEKDYRVGVVCNSDGHKGRPGACYPGASFFGSQGGLTCFIAPQLDRDGIFEAMRRRHHYGTTGNRMLLSVEAVGNSDATVFVRDPALFDNPQTETSRRVNMGDIARVTDDEIELHIEVACSAPIERLDIFDGPDVIETVRTYDASDLAGRVRLVYTGAEYRGRARTTVWDGSLTLGGTTLTDARMFNNWNLDRGIRDRRSDGLTWKAVTTGNFGGIDLWLANGDVGTIRFETPHCHGEREIAALGVEPHVFSAGGLDRAVMLMRLPPAMSERRMRVTRRIAIPKGRDTRLFVRVTQEDGHRAWTSPMYLFR
ncbi:MAG: DUF3604 domain-containing protein [Hyphomicrobiaceae bacterium]